MPTDKEIADKTIQITHLLNQQLKDAHAAGLQIDMTRYGSGEKRPPYYLARIYQPQPDEVIGEVTRAETLNLQAQHLVSAR